MANCLITLRSVTDSMKAKRLLERQGIAAQTVKLDSDYVGRGCSHGIRLDCRHTAQVSRLLTDNSIPYSAIKPL